MGSHNPERHGLRPHLGRAVTALASVLLVCGTLVVASQPAGAAVTITVNTTADQALSPSNATSCPATCSLRAAVEVADNLGSGSGTVTIDVPAGTYDLTLESTLDVGTTSGAVIDIEGTGVVSVVQQQPPTCTTSATATCVGVFALDPNLAGDVAVTLSGLQISGGVGSPDGSSPGGAGVIAGSPGDTTTLTNDGFSGNAIYGSGATPGGAVSQFDGTLSISDCTFTDNSAGTSDGGAVDYEAQDPPADSVANSLTISGSTFTGNTAGDPLGGGGAVYLAAVVPATSSITTSTFVQNSASGGSGTQFGGGAILSTGGALTASQDSFTLNSASGSGAGGAVNVTGGTATLSVNRFYANTAPAGSALSVFTGNSPSVTANNDWWAANAGPGTQAAGITPSSWLQLRLTAAPTAVMAGTGTSTLTADLTHNQADVAVTPTLSGVPVAFSGTLGTPSPTSTSTASGQATSTWTAGSTPGPGTNDASTTVDGVTVSTTIAVQQAPAITSAAATTFTTGHAGLFTVTTTGYPTPSLSETGTLPSPVTFTDNGNGTANLVGTPAGGTGGTYSVTIKASNGVGTDASQSFTLTVDQAPAITSADHASFTVGSAGSFHVTAVGFPASPTITETGALPSGLQAVSNGDNSLTLSGTPGAGTGGTYPLTLQAANGVSPDATQSFTLTVDDPPAITSAAATTFNAGTAGSFSMTATGFPTPTFSETGALPSGVTLSSSGVLSGTAAAGTAGVYPLDVTAANGVNPPATQSFTLTVDGAPAITSADTATFPVGSSSTFTVTTTGFPLPALSETGALPTGVQFTDNGDGTAALAGTPAAGTAGSYAITVHADNGINPPATQSFTLTVSQPPAVTSADATTFTTGTAGSFSVTATGFPAPTFSETGALPSGVTLSSGGLLSGTPAAGTGGTYALDITAANGVSPAATQNFTLTVDQPPAITSADATTFTAGAAGSFSMAATGFPAPTFSETGALPSGVTLSSSGLLSGTPAAGTGGTYVLDVTASNGVSPAATQSFTLTVNQAIVFTSADTTTFTTGTAGSFSMTATGFPAPTFSETGALPSGVTLSSSGVLSGTPAAGTGGTYVLDVTASNGVVADAAQTFTLTVDQVPQITSSAATTFTVGTPGTYTVTTSGFPVPALGHTGALPAGVTLTDNGNGTATLAGTPSPGTGGTAAFTITAGNGVDPPASQSFTLTVDQAPAITSAATTTFTAGQASTFQVSTTGFPKPALTQTDALAPWLTFTDNGNGTATLAGTPPPGTTGSIPLSITADNGVAPPAQQSFDLTVVSLSISTTTLPAGTQGTAYDQQLSAVGGTPPETWTLTGGSLPQGITLDSAGLLSGTPVIAGFFPITVTVTDADAIVASAQLQLVVAPAGFWLATGSGQVVGVGGASNFGSMEGRPLNAPITAVTGTATGNGYWLVGADGGVFAFGDASFWGSLASLHLNGAVVGIAADPSGNGYWLAGSDGGLFALGGAPFGGSAVGLHLIAPVVGVAANPTGQGYWMVTRDGGVFSFGGAGFFGSATPLHPNAPVVALVPTATGDGYWVVTQSGAVFAFGGAGYHGGLPGSPTGAGVVGLTPTNDGGGYWLTQADGTVTSYGDASPVARADTGGAPVVGSGGRSRAPL